MVQIVNATPLAFFRTAGSKIFRYYNIEIPHEAVTAGRFDAKVGRHTANNDGFDPAPPEFNFQIGTDEDWTIAEMWDSGPVVSIDESAIYNGSELFYNIIYYIRIKVYDGSEWSEWKPSWLA